MNAQANINDLLRGAQLGAQAVSNGRATPAEDLVEAADRLNRALRSAVLAGWSVEISAGEQAYFQSGATAGEKACAAVNVKIAKEV